MNMARSAGEVLAEHTTLELECIDRMYLNVYVPLLQTGAGAAWFFRKVRGNPVPSSALMAPMTNRFVAGLKRFAVDHDIDLARFERHERKDDRTRAYLRDFRGDEGVLYVGWRRRRLACCAPSAASTRWAARIRGWCRRRRW